MDTTPVSLLERLRQPGDDEAWRRFVSLGAPLVYSWARRQGLAGHDAADLVQDVFLLLLEKLPEFVYDPARSFRGWLRTVAMNKWAERGRRPPAAPIAGDDSRLQALASPESLDAFWDAEYQRRLVARALDIMRTDFEETTWRACWEHVVSGRSAAEVGADLGLTAGAVYVAKCRVLRRLRQELKGLVE